MSLDSICGCDLNNLQSLCWAHFSHGKQVHSKPADSVLRCLLEGVYFCADVHVDGHSAEPISHSQKKYDIIGRVTVVVIFVKRPATISIISPTGIELISYC